MRKRLLELESGTNFPAYNLAGALKTILGGLVVAAISPGKPADVHLSINSSHLDNATPLDDFPWQSNDEKVTIETSNDTVADLTANFAIYGGFEIDTSHEGLYRFESELKDFGPVKIIEKADWDIDKALNESQKLRIAQSLASHPNAKLL